MGSPADGGRWPGADLRFVQDWIGDASIGNTVVYAPLTSRR
jgi:site-specific recombinase XerD